MRIKWTESAIDCYNRGCICKGCSVKFVIDKCEMKKKVLQIVKVLGKPPKYEYLIDNLRNAENDVVNAILDGCTTKQEIADYLNKKPYCIQQHISRICEAVQKRGYKFEKRCGRLPELINIIFEIKLEKDSYDTRDE